MTTDGHRPSDAPVPTPGRRSVPEPGTVTVTVTFAGTYRSRQAVVEVRGPLPTALLGAVTAPADPGPPEVIVGTGPTDGAPGSPDSLRLTGRATVPPDLVGPLADQLTRPPAPAPAPYAPHTPYALHGAATTGSLETFAATPLQRDVLTDALIHPDHHVEQLSWRWHGPLDTDRFTAAWQSVFDRETVLRAAFVWDPHPQVTVHRHIAPEVVRHPHGTFSGRAALMEHERGRGFDLRRPGLLRAALLDGAPPGTPGNPPPTYVLLTYHRALLDHWSVHTLLREFYRAYCADGLLPGGERRPDLRDYVRWLEAQDPSAARDFWSREAARPAVCMPRAASGAVTGRSGTGRTRVRLTPDNAVRLAEWAARRGITESVAVHAVWAMLLHRASDAGAEPARVRFGVTVSGRGIFLGDIERTPGPFAGPLPVSVEVDPRSTVSGLLRALRDCALDVSGYEWVAEGQIRDWLAREPATTDTPAPSDASGYSRESANSRESAKSGDSESSGHSESPWDSWGSWDSGAALTESLLVFEQRTHGHDGLGADLAARGVRVDAPDISPARTPVPISIVVHHDDQGGLVLTSVHDRARLDDARAGALLAHSAQLLRELPETEGQPVTVAELLDGLPGMDPPRLHERPGAPSGPSGVLTTLRAAAGPRAGTACLVITPGTPAFWLTALIHGTTGAHAVVALHPTPYGTRSCVTEIRRYLRTADGHGPLVLAGLSGAGAQACDIALRLAEDGGTPPPVVLAGGGADAVGALAHAIESALRRTQAGLDRHRGNSDALSAVCADERQEAAMAEPSPANNADDEAKLRFQEALEKKTRAT
ncbi:condensation domain-containing protein [Streptomyces sp. NBC_00046]|uniref:condensation domain-containing protein n=1 Tax=Streptomyces sp. NBC_00046 TaxID=2975626 RepID=UPI002F9067F0